MDGYAVRHDDLAALPATLRVIGTAPAGGAYDGTVAAGEAVRIFTGGPVPDGADSIVIQEDTEAEGDRVTIAAAGPRGHYIRPAGLDFSAGDVGLRAGRVLTARDIGFAAAMNVPWLRVRRRPRVAILSSGDELVNPGDPLGPHQIISSNGSSLAAFVVACGGEATNLGIAADDERVLTTMAAGARGADLLVTSGGASVGDHDLIQKALGDQGLEVDFWKVAMRPGKPLLFGRLGDTPFLGLPYLRATLARDAEGGLVATPFGKQDSSMLSRLARADCLIVRAPHAPAAAAGSRVEIVPLSGALPGL